MSRKVEIFLVALAVITVVVPWWIGAIDIVSGFIALLR